MVEGQRKKVKKASQAKQLSRSALAEKGARESRAHEFVARSVCGVAHYRYCYQPLQLVP